MRIFRRKWLIRFGVTCLVLPVGLILILAVERQVTRWRGEAHLREAVAQLDAAEPGWRIADLNRTRDANFPPPERNAAVQALAALELVPESYTVWTNTQTGDRPPVNNHLLAEEDLELARLVHSESAEALAAIRKLRDLPRGGIPLAVPEDKALSYSLDRTQELRKAAALLVLDSTVLASDKRPAEALAACRAIVNVASGGVGDEPTLISQIVRMALTGIAVEAVEQTLAWNECPAGLPETQARLAAERAAPRLEAGYRGERGVLVRVLENVDDGTFETRVDSPLLGARGPDAWYLRKGNPESRALTIGLFNELIASAKLSDVERNAKVLALESGDRKGNKWWDLWAGTYVVRLLSPAYVKFNEVENRTRARLSCAVAGIACERFRVKTGRWPKSLAEIPGDILAEVPTDPFTGEPLRYATRDDGVTIYSVGQDGADDGGKTPPTRSAVPGPGTDLTFRLWNPVARRAAPVATKPADELE